MCLYPKLIPNKKYTANKKNGGKVPQIKDHRTRLVPVKCGKCMECQRQIQREWQIRLSEEIKHDNSGKFITLTFTNKDLKELSEELQWIPIKIKVGERTLKNGKTRNIYETYEYKPNTQLKGYDLDNAIATLAVRRFLENWRKKHKKSVKHWLVTELGTTRTERLHLHGIIFTDTNNELISKLWKYGIITIGERRYKNGKQLNDKSTGYVNQKSINYIVKYISKTDSKHKEYKPKILTSQGIGKSYIKSINSKNNIFNGKDTKEYYRTQSRHKISLPTYYRNKLYSEEEKEALWINLLDKQQLWVDGLKIDISNGLEQYYKQLEETRRLSKSLGYADDKINWTRKKYEEQRRLLIKKSKMFTRTNDNISPK